MLKFISTKQPVSRAEIGLATGLSQSVTIWTLKEAAVTGIDPEKRKWKNTVYFQEKKVDDGRWRKN